MHFYKIPGFVKWVFPSLTWEIVNKEKEIYLTFDDGPVPGVTDWVLDILAEFDALATFFVVGENVERNHELYQRILDEGHSVGNHTYNHLNAWKCSHNDYRENIKMCHKVLNGYNGKPLFRPPHGKLTPALVRDLKREYSIIMWDVLTGDYNPNISAENCLGNSKKYVSPGSIVVFHDSYKSEEKLKNVLPDYLTYLKNSGYSFKSI